jgi:hypothetical protein
MKWSSIVLGSSVVALLGLAVPVSAGPITGHIGFSGGIVYDTRPDGVGGAGLATLDFYATDGIAKDNGVNTGDGSAIKVGGTSGYFATVGVNGIQNLTTAVIRDITNDPTDDPPSMLVPAGVSFFPVGLPNFLSAFSDPDANGLHFDITELVLQPGSLCTGSEGVGDTCVEGPFRISETATGLDINFDMLGFFRNTISGDEGYYSGKFGMVLNNWTFAELFNKLDNTGQDLMCGVDRDLSCTFSANFDPAAVPEPASLLTFGAGAAVLAALRRRRSAKAAKA